MRCVLAIRMLLCLFSFHAIADGHEEDVFLGQMERFAYRSELNFFRGTGTWQDNSRSGDVKISYMLKDKMSPFVLVLEYAGERKVITAALRENYEVGITADMVSGVEPVPVQVFALDYPHEREQKIGQGSCSYSHNHNRDTCKLKFSTASGEVELQKTFVSDKMFNHTSRPLLIISGTLTTTAGVFRWESKPLMLDRNETYRCLFQQNTCVKKWFRGELPDNVVYYQGYGYRDGNPSDFSGYDHRYNDSEQAKFYYSVETNGNEATILLIMLYKQTMMQAFAAVVLPPADMRSKLFDLRKEKEVGYASCSNEDETKSCRLSIDAFHVQPRHTMGRYVLRQTFLPIYGKDRLIIDGERWSGIRGVGRLETFSALLEIAER